MASLLHLIFLSLLASVSLVRANLQVNDASEDGLEQWGYIEVRSKAHMFWWLYTSPNRVEDPSNPWPIILWLQGGPGGSGVGFVNFMEMGPLDVNLTPRNSTWLNKADLLVVDSLVGVSFSYVEDENLAVNTDDESAVDLTTLLEALLNGNETLQKSPLFIFAESYGGKFAVTLGVSALKAIEAGKLKLHPGVALGDSWISPEDFVFSWGPVLKEILALQIQQHLACRRKDFYNFMLDAGQGRPVVFINANEFRGLMRNRYPLSVDNASGSDPGSLMNGVMNHKLKIIPANLSYRWQGQSQIVFPAMTGDFMRPRIKEVDELLAKGINVTIYNGQVPADQPCISLQMVGNITRSPKTVPHKQSESCGAKTNPRANLH
ncbi:Carboxypeptidase C [Bertholletia excelsa]